jgi:hypothetical protein
MDGWTDGRKLQNMYMIVSSAVMYEYHLQFNKRKSM